MNSSSGQQQQQHPQNEQEQTTSFNIPSIPPTNQGEEEANNGHSIACLAILKRISDVIIVCLICFVGIIYPCLLNLPYFLFFLTILTWLAIYTPLRRRKFNFVKNAILGYIIVHFLVLIAYQFVFFQQFVEPSSFIARLFGLSVLIKYTGLHWWDFQLNEKVGIVPFLNFVSLPILYLFLSIQLSWTKDGTKSRSLAATDHSSRGQGEGDDESIHDELLLNSAGNDSVDIIALQRITSHVMDREKIKKLIKSRRKTISGAAAATLFLTLQEITYLFLYHCYVFALVSMLVWALLYHSIIGLIFLILACFLWALVDSRKWSFRLSPLILAYVELLLIAQYIYNMDLAKELKNDDLLEIIGFKYEENKTTAFVTIVIKVNKAVKNLPFFALSRLNLREIKYNSLSTQDRLKHLKNYGTFDESNIDGGGKLVGVEERKEIHFVFISKALTKYWIFLVVICLLFNTPLASSNNLFSIGFFIFFVFLLLIFQISFRFFRNTIFAFLTLLIIYSSLVLISIYCYQFPSVPEFLNKLTGLNLKLAEEIGLQKYEGEDFG
uniref:Piezo domain-containing protein n=1 Tax=Meloidogyne floridensis TaxID=298350 RepID=A0A915NH37_9BILA